jgi:H+/gluconate symporter-like permease
MQELNKLIAKLVVANIIKLATGLGTGGTATVGESLALVATNLIPGIGGGPTITSIGGGRGNDNWQPPNNGTLSIVNELRQLRRDVYAAQPSAVKLNIRKGELSYAVDRDRKYRMVL